MIIRDFYPRDIDILKLIHKQYYASEFNFPNFYHKFLDALTILTNDERIIVSGGVKTILEAVAITDKSIPVQQRADALDQLLKLSSISAKSAGYDQIHVTVIDDPSWESRLRRTGFNEVKGKVLYLDV